MKEIVKIRTNKPMNWRSKEQYNKTKSWFFEKVNKINKSSTKLIKRRKQKTQINKMGGEKGDIKTDPN
jgi:hypothetical protein